jgi:hypothetical protein
MLLAVCLGTCSEREKKLEKKNVGLKLFIMC